MRYWTSGENAGVLIEEICLRPLIRWIYSDMVSDVSTRRYFP